MIIEIPDYNDSIINVMLNGESYMLRFRYNFFSKFWVMGIRDRNGKDLVTGIKIVPDTVLNASYMLDGLPNGIFTAVSNKERIERKDFAEGNAKFFFISL